jgi:hypothetical protein
MISFTGCGKYLCCPDVKVVGASLARWIPGTLQLALFAVVMLLAAPVGATSTEPQLLTVVADGAAVGTSLAVIAMISFTGCGKYLCCPDVKVVGALPTCTTGIGSGPREPDPIDGITAGARRSQSCTRSAGRWFRHRQ